MELAMLAHRLPAEQAPEWGLINRVYEPNDLMPEAMKLARELASVPTVSLNLIRHAMWQSFENTYEQQLEVERLGQNEVRQTTDFLEGVSAFKIILTLMQYPTWPQILFHLKSHGVIGAELWRIVKDDYDDNVSEFMAEQPAQMKPERARTLRALARKSPSSIYN